MKKKLLAILTILTLVVSHGRRFLGGNASFYAAQVGASSTIAGLCTVTIVQFNSATGVACIAMLAYYVFASVGHYITTSSTPQATTAKRSLEYNNPTFVHLNGTSPTITGNKTFSWYSLSDLTADHYIGNAMLSMA